LGQDGASVAIAAPAEFPPTSGRHPGSASARAEKDALMLVLSRKNNESIVINNNIKVTVVEIRGDKVRLGIVAPRDIPVHREEVFEAIRGATTENPAGSSNP
jgi:carbon storage regulator